MMENSGSWWDVDDIDAESPEDILICEGCKYAIAKGWADENGLCPRCSLRKFREEDNREEIKPGDHRYYRIPDQGGPG